MVNYFKIPPYTLKALALTKTLMESMVGNVPTAVKDAPELITCQVPNVWFGKSQSRLYKCNPKSVLVHDEHFGNH